MKSTHNRTKNPTWSFVLIKTSVVAVYSTFVFICIKINGNKISRENLLNTQYKKVWILRQLSTNEGIIIIASSNQRVKSVQLDMYLPVFGTESTISFYQRILRISGPPAFTFRLQQHFFPSSVSFVAFFLDSRL